MRLCGFAHAIEKGLDPRLGCARSFVGESVSNRSHTDASRMVDERCTSEAVREWHLPVFSMQASFLKKAKRHETKRDYSR